ncbi:alpha/beta fold hydrolase [Ramlibacter sp. Leaf400]|uniref:alpha/beta fold hydrolase n=1 Tax=Ramlibacter sp. Leaf400 TaxID=1736365 RepID=UPI0006FD8066|nr:alpha/beta hydrolase [Ramlibacter sp. Leaf400]KQT07633.1 alpha/beta hydrolase [Ramlibacter sp. Leaf400]
MVTPKLNYVPCADADGGHRMAYWSWGDDEAARVVICVHGLSRQGRDFDVLSQRLIERSRDPVRVVCPDVVGRGRSEWLKNPQGYQLPTYAGDMLALLAQLQAQAPIADLSWFGTSMGGLIGMGIAGSPKLPLPTPIRRLVLNDVGPAVQWAAIQRISGYLGQTGRFEDLQQAADAMWKISTSFGPHTPQQWLALSEAMVKPLDGGGLTLHYDPAISVPVKAMTEAQAAESEAALWTLYDAITARTLITRGAQSDLLSRETALRMMQRGPRAELMEFEGVGHAPTFVAPEQVEAAVSFLLRP